MDNLIIALRMQGKRALIVGGREMAVRKARLLMKTSAAVTVVALSADEEIRQAAKEGRLTYTQRAFGPSDLEDCVLVIAATGNDETDSSVAASAFALNIAVNVPDRPHLSSFNVPALIDRDPVMIGISTDGTAPVLARRLRAQIEAILPTNFGALARFAGEFRRTVAAVLASSEERARFWERFFDATLVQKIRSGDTATARRDAMSLLNRATEADDGMVHIVGAGPGDPDLLTLKALQALQQADVIIYDQLVDTGILDRARRDSLRIYAGKRRADHGIGQDSINQLLVDHARLGRRVVRLKGGDPFIFGRGGEEMAYLQRHGIAVEIVPGITAASGCAAAAGISLTLRGTANAVTFLTGQGQDGLPDINWQGISNRGHTLALYMGIATAQDIADRLIGGGLSSGTPVAVIENGTRPSQRTISATIGTVAETLRIENVTGPAIVLIGDVARDQSQQAAVPGHRLIAAQ